MSQYIAQKSERLKVEHQFSGKLHFYKVTDPLYGKVHNVSVQIGCDCSYMGIQGIANAKMCSDVLAVFKAIVRAAQMDLKKIGGDMNETNGSVRDPSDLKRTN